MHLGFYFPELSFGEKEGSAKHQLQTLLITITEKCALTLLCKLQMQNWSYLEIGRLRMFQLRCLNKHRDSITHNSKKNNSKTHPARRLGRESPLAPRFLDFDLTTTEGRAFASFSWHQKLRSEMVKIVLNISSPSWKTMLWRSLNSIAFGASECRDQNAIPRKLGLTQFLGALIELGLAASAKISTRLSITCKDTRECRYKRI